MPKLNDATALYIGSTVATAAYQGSVQVWPAAAPPPSVGTDPTTVAGFSALWTVDSLTGVTDGAEVDSFAKSAGTATNTTFTAAAGNGLTYRAAAQNGLPVLTSAAKKAMFTSGLMSPVVGSLSTVFFVGRFSAMANNQTIFDGYAANGYRLYANGSGGVSFFVVNGGTTAYTLPNPNSWHVFGMRRNGTAAGGLTLWVDGTKVGTGTSTDTTGSNQLRLFGDGSADFGAGDFGELVSYNSTALADTDMLGVTRNLGNKWGVTVA